jgi:hypothetical protein
MAQRMSFDFGLDKTTACFKRKYRWLLKIDGVSAEGIDALPPTKSGRPNLTFKSIFKSRHYRLRNLSAKLQPPHQCRLGLFLGDRRES